MAFFRRSKSSTSAAVSAEWPGGVIPQARGELPRLQRKRFDGACLQADRDQ